MTTQAVDKPSSQTNQSRIDETPTSAEFCFFNNEVVKPLSPEVRPVMPLLNVTQLTGSQTDFSAEVSVIATTLDRSSTATISTLMKESPVQKSEQKSPHVDYADVHDESVTGATPSSTSNPMDAFNGRGNHRRRKTWSTNDGLFKRRDFLAKEKMNLYPPAGSSPDSENGVKVTYQNSNSEIGSEVRDTEKVHVPSATPSSAVAAASMMTERASDADISNAEKASNTEEMPISTIIDTDSNIVHGE